MLALPALLCNGLLKHNDVFSFEEKYYSLPSILLTLSYAFLLRINSIEKISDEPPGEFGKLLGLDRIPEIKTLRKKISILSQDEQSGKWMAEQSKGWMSTAPELAGILYIDGHEGVFYGKTNKLPKRFISRLRLSMRATTDYWVCDQLGQPFFSINKHVSGSMIETIKQDIIPRLLKDVPSQPTEEALEQDNLLHRFMIVYDRECYSSDFIIDMWDKRIACSTYNKYVNEKWLEEEFSEYEITDEYGEKETIKLAERAVLIEGKETEKLSGPITVYTFEKMQEKIEMKTKRKYTKKKKSIWVREVRRLSNNGHQTSIITSNYKLSILLVGLYMFARWRQENYFKYMIKHFGLDMIISNLRQTISDTTLLINPAWRKLDKDIRSINGKLQRLEAKFGALSYDTNQKEESMKEKELKKYNNKKAGLQEDISIYRNQVAEYKEKRNKMPKKIAFSELSDDQKFEGVYNERKQFVDTIKMIVYRAEISLTSIVKKYTKKPKEAHALMMQFFKSSADLKVDIQKEQLHINIHHQPTNRDDIALKELCNQLNETECIYPGTNMKIIYDMLP